MESANDGHLSTLSDLWRGYSMKVYGGYSPVNSALALAVSADRGLLDRVSRCPPHAHDPNMLLASIQYLVRGGVDHPIGLLYSDFDESIDPAPLIESLWVAHGEEIDHLMATRRIQTNECGRAPVLALGLSKAAEEMGTDRVALIDAGASAGLNLILDKYRLSFGDSGEIGPADSPVVIACQTRDRRVHVPERLPVIEHRLGLDRQPVDLSDERNVRWLLSCIWPGTGRHERAEAAIRLAGQSPTMVRDGDMVADLPGVLEEMSPWPTVVVTSWSYSYLPGEQRLRFQEVLTQAGRQRPVAWVCADNLGVVDLFAAPDTRAPGELIPGLLGLALFAEEGVRARTLAYVQPHGAWVDWLDPH
jgi:hypothetical protein